MKITPAVNIGLPIAERQRGRSLTLGDFHGSASVIQAGMEVPCHTKAVAITGDWTAFELRRLAAASKYASQSRRLLSLVAVLAGMGRQTLNDWVRRFNARGPKG